MLPLKPHPVVGDTKHSDIVGLDELHDSVVEEPIRDGWILDYSFDLELGSSGQMRFASSGHWRSVALWVKKMVGSPSVSTMESSRQRWRYQYCLVPRRVEA